MKETRFRAWDKINREMILWNRLLNGYNLRNVFMRPEMCGLILMQYTGLKDKNGVEIFEGDIIEFVPLKTSINNRVVKFEKGVFKAELIRSGSSVALFAFQESEIKVIGNIYENSDLLN